MLKLIALMATAPVASNPCEATHWEMSPSATRYVEPGSIVESNSQDDKLRFAMHLIKLAVPECAEADFGIDLSSRSKNHCERVASGQVFSEICYLTGKYGYYFTHVNLMDQGIVTFNRWD